MKYCLIHKMLGCVYAYLLLEVWLRDLDKSFHISYLYIEYSATTYNSCLSVPHSKFQVCGGQTLET